VASWNPGGPQVQRRFSDAIDASVSSMRPLAHSALVVLVGFWPLFLIMGVCLAYMWIAALHSSP
jgi:hypothetical protein